MRLPIHAVCIALNTVLCLPSLQAQFLPPLLPQQHARPPEISITVPASVNSESLQGEYFLFGSFGTSFEYVIAKPNVSGYVIKAAVNGIPASTPRLSSMPTAARRKGFL
jgi:hypothetical protein